MTDTHDDSRTGADDRPADEPDADRLVSRETVARAVDRVAPDWTVTNTEPAAAGHQIVVLLTVETPAGRRDCVLKATAPDAMPAASSEARLLAWLGAGTTLPVPEVYGVVDAEAAATDDLPVPLFLMERVPGRRAPRRRLGDLSPARHAWLARRLGRHLATLHELEPTAFGYLSCPVREPLDGGRPPVDPDISVDGAPEWPAFYRRTARETLADLSGSRFGDVAPDARPAVERGIERVAADGPYRPAVAHIDGNPDNLLFDDDGVTAVLDWEFTMTTPPAYDLVCIEAALAGGLRALVPGVPDRRETVRSALAAGYRAGADVVDADRVLARVEAHHGTYRLLTYLRSMTLFDDWFVTFGASDDERAAAARTLRDRVRDSLER